MTNTLSYRKVLWSLLALGVIGAVAGSATVAFYGDVERSTGNTFTAGGVELKVDSVSHYNNMICTDTDEDGVGDEWQPEAGFVPEAGHYPATGSECDGTWDETDLEDGVHTFFNFSDLKPGDWGEDTISIHVYDNPAWGKVTISGTTDSDVSCTESEQVAEEGACAPDADGEIDDYLLFTGWVDQGAVAGFQCGDLSAESTGAECDADPTEGDNIYQTTEGPKFWDSELIGDGRDFELAPVLAAAYELSGCTEVTGDTEYDVCHGYAADGRMVASVTYYFGIGWELPLQATGNDAQTDTLGGDITFMVEQHRNNPDPFQTLELVSN